MRIEIGYQNHRMSADSKTATLSPAEARERELRDRFVQEHMKRIFLLTYRIVGNVADAQDLTQEAFVKALSRQEQLKDLDKAAHWLSRIATNTALDHLRRKGRVRFTELEELPESLSVSDEPSPEVRAMRGQRREFLEKGLSVLTDRERAALLLRDVEELPAEEVAEHLECSKATVRSHIANARVKFKRFLDRHREVDV